ncbi:MAG TPA: HI0074 family nucleotidyltransferase substrate-binding subunit [Cyclobacteriaceae bacterium]|nr:HI0074 family nucleotidyltransferase substrate-binding subunit [Cyclobacteriaceae bacterium]
MKKSIKTVDKCFSDFQSALAELKELVEEAKFKSHQEKYEQKVIRAFEVSHELALTTMSEYLRTQGRPAYMGPRDTTVEAFHDDLIDDGEGWLDMIIIRIKTTPIYNEDTTKPLYDKILSKYIRLFENFENRLTQRLENN